MRNVIAVRQRCNCGTRAPSFQTYINNISNERTLAATLAAGSDVGSDGELRCASAKQNPPFPSAAACSGYPELRNVPENQFPFQKTCHAFQAHSGKLCQADDTIFKSHARSCSWLPERERERVRSERERVRETDYCRVGVCEKEREGATAERQTRGETLQLKERESSREENGERERERERERSKFVSLALHK